MGICNKDNKLKARKGNGFNKTIGSILFDYKKNGYIIDYIKEPEYATPNSSLKQFNPDFEITLNNKTKVVIDNTTTIRSDRVKQKQWDAFGIKKHFQSLGENVTVYVVVPNKDTIGNKESNQKEVDIYLNERIKILRDDYFSMIDDIIEVDELKDIIISSSNMEE